MTISAKEEKAKELLGCEMLLVGVQNIEYCAAFSDRLEFGQFKMWSMVSNGNPPQTVFYEDIADVVVSHGGFMNGRFSIEKKGQQGADSGGIEFGSRPYMVPLTKKHNDVADKLREYILDKVKEIRDSQKSETSTQSQSDNISVADEIKKFAELKEQGVISEEEFEAKKKELLGL